MNNYFNEYYLNEEVEDRIIKATDRIVFRDLVTNKMTSIQEYLMNGCTGYINNFNLISYWLSIADCPIRRFALDLISIPGSNCSIERLFSYSSIIEDKKRLKLSSEKKSKLVCLQCWIKNDSLETL